MNKDTIIKIRKLIEDYQERLHIWFIKWEHYDSKIKYNHTIRLYKELKIANPSVTFKQFVSRYKAMPKTEKIFFG